MLKAGFALDFGQIGLITLTFQLTASLLQPLVGLYTDHRPQAVLAGGRHGLHAGRAAAARRRRQLHGAAASAPGWSGWARRCSIPESSRVARMASGGRHGFAQSLFQVGGNAGSAIGPLLAAFIVLPRGQRSVAWFSLAALLGDRRALAGRRLVRRAPPRRGRGGPRRRGPGPSDALARRRCGVALAVLIVLIFSKYFYLASLTSYYTFYLIDHFGVGVGARSSTCSCSSARSRPARSSAARSATGSAASR